MARSTRSVAERAALAAQREEMQRRAAYVGAVAETQERVQTLLADLAAALEDHDRAFRAALDEGWTAKKLAEVAGLKEDPTGGARRALRRAAIPASRQAESGPAASVDHAAQSQASVTLGGAAGPQETASPYAAPA